MYEERRRESLRILEESSVRRVQIQEMVRQLACVPFRLAAL